VSARQAHVLFGVDESCRRVVDGSQTRRRGRPAKRVAARLPCPCPPSVAGRANTSPAGPSRFTPTRGSSSPSYSVARGQRAGHLFRQNKRHHKMLWSYRVVHALLHHLASNTASLTSAAIVTPAPSAGRRPAPRWSPCVRSCIRSGAGRRRAARGPAARHQAAARARARGAPRRGENHGLGRLQAARGARPG